MARKAKETTEQAKTLNADDLRGFVKEAVRAQQNASELASSAGGYIKNQIERLGLNAKAAKQVVKLSKMEEAHRQTFLRDLLNYAFLMGHFDQIDMFDDTGKILTLILDRIEGDAKKIPNVDPAVTQFN